MTPERARQRGYKGAVGSSQEGVYLPGLGRLCPPRHNREPEEPQELVWSLGRSWSWSSSSLSSSSRSRARATPVPARSARVARRCLESARLPLAPGPSQLEDRTRRTGPRQTLVFSPTVFRAGGPNKDHSVLFFGCVCVCVSVGPSAK